MLYLINDYSDKDKKKYITRINYTYYNKNITQFILTDV